MDSEWLKLQFSYNPGRSKAELARALGLEPPAVSKILAGDRQIKAQEYNTMRKFFGLPIDGERSVQTNARLTPLNQNSMQEPLGSEEESENAWIIPPHILRQRTNTPIEHIRVFTISEKVMEPEFSLGEHILVDEQDCSPTPPGFFVISDGFGQMVRMCEVSPLKKDKKIKISAAQKGFDSQMLDLDDVKILGRVIAKLQWL